MNDLYGEEKITQAWLKFAKVGKKKFLLLTKSLIDIIDWGFCDKWGYSV